MPSDPESPADPESFRVSAVGSGDWPDLCRLFEQRGGPHYCWCMAWREMPSKARGDKSAKKAEMQRRVLEGVPVGLIGYAEEAPVAWCSVGPRSSFRRLADDDGEGGQAVWCITCFFVARAHRGRGLADRMIENAITYARSNGADAIEAYPVAPDAPSYRFMGFVPQFERAGFVHAGKTGKWRHVMRLPLG